MPPRVLLHVIEPAVPVDHTVHAHSFGNRTVEHMADYSLFTVDDLDDAAVAQRAGVEWLSARSGIESRPIKDCSGSSRDMFNVLDGRIEFSQVWIGLVEAVGRHKEHQSARPHW